MEDLTPLCRAPVQLSCLEPAEPHDTKKGKSAINSHDENDEQEKNQGVNTNLNTLCLLSSMAMLHFYLQDLALKKKKSELLSHIYEKSSENSFKALLKQIVCFV